MNNIRNISQLRAEQKRLNLRQKELEEIIVIKWKDTLNQFRPSAMIRKGALTALQKIIEKLFPMK